MDNSFSDWSSENQKLLTTQASQIEFLGYVITKKKDVLEQIWECIFEGVLPKKPLTFKVFKPLS